MEPNQTVLCKEVVISVVDGANAVLQSLKLVEAQEVGSKQRVPSPCYLAGCEDNWVRMWDAESQLVEALQSVSPGSGLGLFRVGLDPFPENVNGRATRCPTSRSQVSELASRNVSLGLCLDKPAGLPTSAVSGPRSLWDFHRPEVVLLEVGDPLAGPGRNKLGRHIGEDFIRQEVMGGSGRPLILPHHCGCGLPKVSLCSG